MKKLVLALKRIKDAGIITPADREDVSSRFKDIFGMGLGKVLKRLDAKKDQMDSSDKKVLKFLKQINDAKDAPQATLPSAHKGVPHNRTCLQT